MVRPISFQRPGNLSLGIRLTNNHLGRRKGYKNNQFSILGSLLQESLQFHPSLTLHGNLRCISIPVPPQDEVPQHPQRFDNDKRQSI